jgi:hypothetical protein
VRLKIKQMTDPVHSETYKETSETGD